MAAQQIRCRPCERRDPYAAAEIVETRWWTALPPDNNAPWLWVPAFAGTTAVSDAKARTLPRLPHRTRPIFQREPDAARQPKAVDRGGAAEGLEAVQLDAAPLEAALLQDVARGEIGDARAGEQEFPVELLKEIIDHGARSFGAKALAPMLDAEPVAKDRRV